MTAQPARSVSPDDTTARWPFTVVPAVDPETERAAIGAVVLHPGVADQVLPYLTAEQFTDTRHRDLLTVLKALHAATGAVDAISTERELTRRTRDGIIGGNHRAVLHASLVDAPRTESAGISCAQLVVENAARRRVAQAGMRLLAASQDGRGGLGDLLGRAHEETDRLETDLAGHFQVRCELRGERFPQPAPATGRPPTPAPDDPGELQQPPRSRRRVSTPELTL